MTQYAIPTWTRRLALLKLDPLELGHAARTPRSHADRPRIPDSDQSPMGNRAARTSASWQAGLLVHRLFLLRHAKSSWEDPDQADHDRPLAARGRRAAKAIARHLREQGIEPELVLCSTARRARETLERIEPALGAAHVRFEPALYGTSAGALLERLHDVPDDVGSVMLIGHNPGLQELALELAHTGPELHELNTKFPTAALATLELSDWRTARPGTAELVGFVRPRDLAP